MRRQALTVALALALLGGVLAACFAEDTPPPPPPLVNDDFEACTLGGTTLPRWNVYVDEGNAVTVVDTPAVGQRAVRFTDIGGAVWKPAICSVVNGQADAFLRWDFDWRINQTVDRWEKAFTFLLRGTGNKAVVTVTLGGPGGVAVRQGKEWVALDAPVRLNEWNHLTVYTDPISLGEKGACTVIVTQGDDKAVLPNLAYPAAATWPEYPAAWWYSPLFSLGGSMVAGAGVEAYLDNVKVQVVDSRPANP